MNKWSLIVGGVFCATAVMVGAFGAHALKPILSAKAMGWIDTGVFYHATHGMALIVSGLIPNRTSVYAAFLFGIGILLFSGSLYLMALTGVTKLGIITPIGGVSLLVGWVLFCFAAWRLPHKESGY